jgi:hypothetical protein
MVRYVACLLVVLSMAAGCGSQTFEEREAGNPAEAAQTVCENEAAEFASIYSTTPVSLLSSHATTPEAFGNWDRDRLGPDGPHPEPIQRAESPGPQQFLAYCYFSGQFDSFPKGPPSSEPPPAYTRIAVTMDSKGFGTVHRVGPESMDTSDAPPGPSA